MPELGPKNYHSLYTENLQGEGNLSTRGRRAEFIIIILFLSVLCLEVLLYKCIHILDCVQYSITYYIIHVYYRFSINGSLSSNSRYITVPLPLNHTSTITTTTLTRIAYSVYTATDNAYHITVITVDIPMCIQHRLKHHTGWNMSTHVHNNMSEAQFGMKLHISMCAYIACGSTEG